VARRSEDRVPKAYAEAYSSLIAEEKKPVFEEDNWYYRIARKLGKAESPMPFKDLKLKQAIDFLGWDLSAEQVSNTTTLFFAASFIPCVFIALLLIFFSGLPYYALMYVLPMLLLGPIALTYYVQRYPIFHADSIKMRSVLEVPEIVNYMVISMKLSPNLERAIDFASEHGRGKIASELKELSWNLKMGIYSSAEEALDKLAYKWGQYSDEFKHALMLIRSSVIEVDEAKRHAILDKAIYDVLEGIKDDMDKYAMKMRQPSIYLYYVGVLLPLMLIIMLPIGSIMANLPFAQLWVLVLIYNILVPLGAFVFARQILSRRPPVYEAPHIPDDHPELPKKAHIKIGNTNIPVILLAVFAMLATAYLFIYVFEPFLNPNPAITRPWDKEAIASYIPFFTMAGYVMSAVIFVSVYLYGSTYPKKKLQDKIMRMEADFQDSIYILASRLGENRPIEEAVEYTANFLTDSPLSRTYRITAENIKNLGMTIEAAFFDPAYGSLRHVPSKIIKNTVRVVIDSLSLGVQQGARVLLSLSIQLRDAKKVKEKVRAVLEEITAMMRSIAYLIAPLVLGITSALQKVIVGALLSLGGSEFIGAGPSAGIPVGFINPQALASMPDAMTFLIIITIYVLEITVLLLYFITKINEGDNPLALKMSIAKTVPIAMTLFFFAAWFASTMAA